MMKFLHRLDKASKSTYNSLYSNKGNKRRREEVAGFQSQTESSRPVKGAWENLSEYILELCTERETK